MNDDLFAAQDAGAQAPRDGSPMHDFFALRPDAQAGSLIRAHAQGFAGEECFAGMRVRGNPHITVVFVDGAARLRSARETALAQAGAAVAVAAATIDVVLDGVMSFHVGERGHPLVLRADAAAARAIAHLRRQLLAALQAQGFRPSRDKAFVPHLTLGYPRMRLETVRLLDEPVCWRADRLFLVRSHVGRGLHEVLAAWPLAGTG